MPESNVVGGSQPIPCLPPGAVMVALVGVYFSRKKVIGVTIREELSTGDSILYHSLGEWKQRIVDSIQKDHVPIDVANPGMTVGIFIGEPVDEGSAIYKLPPQ